MERIGNVGWFMTDEEHNELLALLDGFCGLFGKQVIDRNFANEPLIDQQECPKPEINKPCPNYPYQYPWTNPWDWTWRPWQAPWYEYEVGDGEWWKNPPYCSTTTGEDPNLVKNTYTANKSEEDDRWKEFTKYVDQKLK